MFAFAVTAFIASASPEGVPSVILSVILFIASPENALPSAIPITVFCVFAVIPSVTFCSTPPSPASSLLVKSPVNPSAAPFNLSIPLVKSPNLSNLSMPGILDKVSFLTFNFAERLSIPVRFFTFPKSSSGLSIVFKDGTPDIAPPSLSPRPPMPGMLRSGTNPAISVSSPASAIPLNPLVTASNFPLARSFALPSASLIPAGLPDATKFKGDFKLSSLEPNPVIEPSIADNACGVSPPVFSALTVNPAESYPESAPV